ncbi:MAG: hypothetical protein ACKVIH_01545 [Burkholderiales bacterium]
MTPKKITFEIGQTKFKQLVEATYQDGVFQIRKYAASQRDEDEFVNNLTPEMLAKLADCAASVKAMGA